MQRLPAGYLALLPRSSSFPQGQGQHATKPHPATLSLSSPGNEILQVFPAGSPPQLVLAFTLCPGWVGGLKPSATKNNKVPSRPRLLRTWRTRKVTFVAMQRHIASDADIKPKWRGRKASVCLVSKETLTWKMTNFDSLTTDD